MRALHHLGLPVLLLLAIPLVGQDVRDPRPGQPPPPPVGTSRISGQVVAADTGTPVKRAAVNLVGRPPMDASGRGRASVQLSAVGRGSGPFAPRTTDEAGRFEFEALPAGMYSIMVMPRGGFVRPQRPELVEVADGNTASIVIKLNRTGVISGRLLDEGGEPLSRARVMALRRDTYSGGRNMPTAGGDTTDDLGGFRLFDLPPGEYFVTAQDSFMGPMDAAGGSEGYAPTYYPGSPSLDGARVVVVRSAQETPGIEFSLARVVMGRVSGTVRDSSGQVLSGRGGSVNLARRSDESMTGTRGAGIRPDGSFVIGQVPPGDYYLVAAVSIGQGPNAAREGAYVPVTVNGNDVTVDLQTNKGATVRGRVIVEGTPQAPPLEIGPWPDARISVTARPMTMGPLGVVTGSVRPATVNEDGTFELTGLRGPLLLTASGMRAALKSVTHGAEDLTASPMEFKGTELVNNVTIVLTYDIGTIDGTVTDDGGQPAPGAMVVIFPDDESRWFRGSPFVHYTRSMMAVAAAGSQSPAARPGVAAPARAPRAAGSFTSAGLLPGRYYIAAVDGDSGSMPQMGREPLERLRKHAVVATVTPTGASSVQLRIVRAF